MPSGECSIEPWVFMNWRRAAYYLFTAEVIDAKKALEVVLSTRWSAAGLDDRVDAIARHIAQAPLTTLMLTKANLKRAWELMGMRVHWQSSNGTRRARVDQQGRDHLTASRTRCCRPSTPDARPLPPH